jgi:beta-1,4-mannooligosaccharide/beta-1,4-mannosyl-N-acetylglucosamine phosphorylase
MRQGLRNHPQPVLTRAEIPAFHPDLRDASSVFNPGALRHEGLDRLLLRVQDRGRRTHLVPASTTDGRRFSVEPRDLAPPAGWLPGRAVHHVYDARLTWLDGMCHVLAAVDLDEGCRLALGRWSGFGALDWLGLTGERDERNGVLFPRRLSGEALRLARPNRPAGPGDPASGSEIWLQRSRDLLEWNPVACLARGRFHYWDELIGPGPPPVETEAGWLCVYHGVATHFAAANIYQAGVLLLDRRDPTRVLGRSRLNILEPRHPWELAGQVPNVVFPSGLTVDLDENGLAPPEAPFRLYYGAADTCVGLAEGSIADLLAACERNGAGEA